MGSARPWEPCGPGRTAPPPVPGAGAPARADRATVLVTNHSGCVSQGLRNSVSEHVEKSESVKWS